MNWNSFSDFLAMGGYGLYVWGSLGMCAAALAAEVLLLRLRQRQLQRETDDMAWAESNEVKG